jgi:hypothetical protein
MRKEKKSNKNIRCNEIRLMPTSPGLSTSNKLRLSRNTKNNFTQVELDPLHKNELPRLLVTRVITHSKRVSDNTLKNKK